MKNIPDWVQAVIAILLFAGAIGGMYAANQVAISTLEHRVSYMEQRQYELNSRTTEVLDKLATSVDNLSLSTARLDERLKALEEDR